MAFIPSSEAGVPIELQRQRQTPPKAPVVHDLGLGKPRDNAEVAPQFSQKGNEGSEVSPADAAEFSSLPTGEPEIEPQPESEVYEEECEEEVIDTCGDESKYPIVEDCIEDVYEDCAGDVGEWQCEEEEYIECDDAIEPAGDYEEDCEEVVVEDQCVGEPEPEMHISGPGMETQETAPTGPTGDEL